MICLNVLNAQSFIADHLKLNEPSKLDTLIQIKSNDGNKVEIPLTIIKGAQKGPTFTIIAGIHGMEYPTMMSLVLLSREIDPQKLKGNVLIMPIVNMPSFFQRVPFLNPIDKLNLNRVFPGNKNGTITEVMADFMTNEIYTVTDVLLDMHGGDVSEDLLPFICYYDNKEFKNQTNLAAKLSNVSGFENIVSYPFILEENQPAKYAFKQAVRQGVNALSIEIGKLGEWKPEEAEFTKDAIYRMFSELKMYDKKVPEINQTKNYYTQQSYISVLVQGIFYSTFKAGDKLKKDEVLGTIKDVFGNELAVIKAPESGIILYKIGTPPVNVGETMFCIGL